jgi:hypothetical protein
MQTPFEEEYSCLDDEYEEVRASAIAVLSDLFRVSVSP